MKRPTPLSMKRLHVMSAQFLISLGIEKGTAAQQLMLDFLKYVWEHKDNDLTFMAAFEAKKKELKSPTPKVK